MAANLELDLPLRIFPGIQHYSWGKPGACSLVAKLSGGDIEDNLPYAELWYGAHHKSPSLVAVGGKQLCLNKLIRNYPVELLGERVYQDFGSNLPFLWKILSIENALSIQVHPLREQAKLLHLNYPEYFPDDNHKPEIAISLSSVELLHGFRSLDDIKRRLLEVVAFQKLVTEKVARNILELPSDNFSSERALTVVCEVLTAVLTAPEAKIRDCSLELYAELKQKGNLSPEEWKILEQEKLYPEGDAGLFCFYILDYLVLNAGEWVYTSPGIPHAYLRGDLVECMATSDNVIRAAFTNKHRDTQLFVDTVENSGNLLDAERIRGTILDSESWSFLPTFAEEFSICTLGQCNKPLGVKTSGIEILLCTSGQAVLKSKGKTFELSTGDAYLIPGGLSEYSIQENNGMLFRCQLSDCFSTVT